MFVALHFRYSSKRNFHQQSAVYHISAVFHYYIPAVGWMVEKFLLFISMCRRRSFNGKHISAFLRRSLFIIHCWHRRHWNCKISFCARNIMDNGERLSHQLDWMLTSCIAWHLKLLKNSFFFIVPWRRIWRLFVKLCGNAEAIKYFPVPHLMPSMRVDANDATNTKFFHFLLLAEKKKNEIAKENKISTHSTLENSQKWNQSHCCRKSLAALTCFNNIKIVSTLQIQISISFRFQTKTKKKSFASGRSRCAWCAVVP